jgi:class 3 adenylate cyclase
VKRGPISYARNGEVSIAYRVFGEGEVDLLLVGGFVGHLEILDTLPQVSRFFDRLGSFCRVIWFDKRGMGLSDRDAGAYTVEGVAEDMLAVLDAVGCERAAVFGVSEGGCAATYFAATYPDRTTAMIQYGTYARMAQAPDFPEGVPVESIRRLISGMIEQWGESAHLEWWAPSWRSGPDEVAWWGRLLRAGTSPGGVRQIGEMYERLDVRPLLELIRVPSLVMWRAGDRLVPPRLSKAVADGIPGARGVELAGADHLFAAGDQDEILGEIEEFLTGRRTSPQPERALATVLFTDIVGSTGLAAEVGDRRWRELLSGHDRTAARAIAAERGRLVKSTGDGVLATFDGPGRAIAAACTLRDELAPAGVQIRAGVHTGECEWLDEDVGGLAVHIGARVSGAAGPGEVLVSQTVRDLVVGSELEFEDRGAHTLKGVPGEWRLFAVASAAAR